MGGWMDDGRRVCGWVDGWMMEEGCVSGWMDHARRVCGWMMEGGREREGGIDRWMTGLFSVFISPGP